MQQGEVNSGVDKLEDKYEKLNIYDVTHMLMRSTVNFLNSSYGDIHIKSKQKLIKSCLTYLSILVSLGFSALQEWISNTSCSCFFLNELDYMRYR